MKRFIETPKWREAKFCKKRMESKTKRLKNGKMEKRRKATKNGNKKYKNGML